jgi:hypothetical protein
MFAVLAGCSAPAPAPAAPPTPPTPPAHHDRVAAIDAGVVDPEPTDERCVRGGSVTRLVRETIVLCDEYDVLECIAYAVDGAATPTELAVTLPNVTVDEAGTSVQVCTADDPCFAIRPVLTGDQRIWDATIDASGARVAIVMDPDVVEVWSATTGTRIARANIASVEHLAYLGDTLVIVTSPEVGPSTASLWRLSKKHKLARFAELEGEVTGWTAASPGVGVFALDGEIAVIDLASGARTGVLSWRALLAPEEQAERATDIALAGDGDRVAVVAAIRAVVDGQNYQLWRAGVFALDDTPPTRFAIPLCEGLLRIDRFDTECLKNPLGC